MQGVTIANQELVWLDNDLNVKISGWAATCSYLTASGKLHTVTGFNTCWNLYGNTLARTYSSFASAFTTWVLNNCSKS
jgi:hypothetical protein